MPKTYNKSDLPGLPSGMYWRGMKTRKRGKWQVNWSSVVRVVTDSTPQYVFADGDLDLMFKDDDYLYQPIPYPRSLVTVEGE